MKHKTAALLAIALAVESPCYADEAVSLAPLLGSTYEASPPATITMGVMARNDGQALDSLQLDIGLPEGWRLLTPFAPFSLGVGEKDVFILPVSIPPNILPGEYAVDCRLYEADGFPLAALTLPIQILRVTKLDVRPIQVPISVKAGDTYEIQYSVTNAGNEDLWLRASGSAQKGFTYAFYPEESAEFNLGRGQVAMLTVRVGVPLKTYDAFRHTFTLILTPRSLDGSERPTTRSAATVEIIPLLSGRTSVEHTLPGNAASSMTGSFGQASALDGALEVDIAGSLDKAGRHEVELHLGKVFKSRNLLLMDPTDKYYALYGYGFFKTGVGDLAFSASELADGKRNGFGIYADADLVTGEAGRLGFGGYFFGNRFASGSPLAAAAYLAFDPQEAKSLGALDYKAKASFTSLLGRSFTAAFLQEITPIRGMTVALEAAAGDTFDGSWNPAILFKSAGDWEMWFYQIRMTAAAAGYPGPFANTLYTNLNAGLRLMERRLVFTGSFRLNDDNLGAVALQNIHPWGIETLIDAALSRPEAKANFTAGLGYRARRDAFSPSRIDNDGFRAKLGYSQGLPLNMSLQLIVEHWLVADAYMNRLGLDQSYSAALSANPLQDLTANFTSSIKISDYFGSPTDDKLDLDLSANARYGVGFLTTGMEIGNSWEFTGGNLDQSTFSLQANAKYLLPWTHSVGLTLGLNLSSVENMNAFRFKLEYNAPFGITFREKVETGLIKIKVVDDSTGRGEGPPLKDVIIRMGDAATVTNSEGIASFRVAKPGTYYAYVDGRSIPAGYVPRVRVPLESSIELQQEVTVRLPMTQGCLVQGRVQYFDFDNSLSSFSGGSGLSPEDLEKTYVERFDLPTQVLVLRNGDDMRVVTTDKGGAFAFKGLYSGLWLLSFGAGRLPPYHYYDQPTLEIHLDPGQEVAAYFRVLPQARTIQVTEDLGDLVVISAAPTPSPLPSPSPAPAESPAPVESPSPAPSPIPSAEPSPEPTLSPLPSIAPSPTPDASPSPASAESPIPAGSPSSTPDGSPAPSSAPTTSPLPIPSAPPPSPLPTASPEPSMVPAPSLSPSPSPPPSPSPDLSPSPSPSSSPAPLPSASPFPSPRPSPRPSPTPKPSPKPSSKPSPTPTPVYIPPPDSTATPDPFDNPFSLGPAEKRRREGRA